MKYGLYAFFEKNGAFYIKKKSKKSKACTQDQKIKYDELLAQAHKKIKVQEKIDQLGSSTLSTQAEVDLLPSLSDVYSIEQIENGAVGITAIVNYLLGITNAEIAWIKEIRALRGDIKVLGGDQTDIVSVKDFIIDRKQRKYFFTYNNNFYCEEVPYDESSGLYDKINYDYRNDYIPRIVAVHEERKHRKLSKLTSKNLGKIKDIMKKHIIKSARKDQLPAKLAELKKQLESLKQKLEALKKGLKELSGALQKAPGVT